MRFAVVWNESAEQELANLWLRTTEREELSHAANVIDQELAASPALKGTLSFDTVRILVVPPLAVEFEVIEPDRHVYVLSVWLRRSTGSQNGQQHHD